MMKCGMFVHIDRNSGVPPVFHLPLRVSNKVITLWTGPTHCRYFTRDNLPSVIKQKLAMIGALNYPNYNHLSKCRLDLEAKENERLRKGAYHESKRECPDEFKDVGWRVNDKYYYVVLTEEELMPMTLQAEEWIES